MTVAKFSVSFSSDLAEEVANAADRQQNSVSGWLADAANIKLKLTGAEQLLAEWEADHGLLPAADLAAVEELWPA